MKAIFIIKFYAALLLTIIPDGVRTDEHEIIGILDTMVENGGEIDGIFKPSVNGSLGSGHNSGAYRGKFIPLDIDVAMKFTPIYCGGIAANEYKMYSYLNAVNDPAEAMTFGIPAIYYYGEWEEYIILAMTLLDSQFERKVKAKTVTESDLLIAFREFVRIMKYIHGKGILHNDIRTDNIIIQNDQGFIFDFGESLEMSEDDRRWNIEKAKSDFVRYLHSIFDIFRSALKKSSWRWLGLSRHRDAERRIIWDTFSNELAKDADSDEWNSFTGLRRIFAVFAKHALDTQSTSIVDANGTLTSFYDHIYCVIIGEMQNYGIGATSSHPPLSDLPNPFGNNKWIRGEVNEYKFQKEYAAIIKAAREK